MLVIGKFWAIVILGAGLGPVIARAADDEVAPPPLRLVVSVAEQKLAVVKDGGVVRKYAVSTSKFGLGDSFNSYRTPLGRLRVCDKIGDDLPAGAVLKSRNATGEILPANAPGRDPIVTRILWLEGLESGNANARGRGIYIHGTVEESKLGQPVSYGCIRMRSRDVVEIFDTTAVGTPVEIIADRFPQFRKFTPKTDPLLASNDRIFTTFGPRGMLSVRTVRPGPAVAGKPAAAPEPIRVTFAKTDPVGKPAAPTPKTPEPVAKIAAKTPPPPVPAAEGPTVLLTTSGTAARLKVAIAQPSPAAGPDEPRVLLMSESILTANLKPKAAPAPRAPEPVAKPASRRLIALDIASVSFALLDDDARHLPPMDILSQDLYYPPTPQMRLAFRAQLPQPDL